MIHSQGSVVLELRCRRWTICMFELLSLGGLVEFLVSLLSGFAGSLLVVVFLYRLRPSLEISKYVVRRSDDTGEHYCFKVINRTPYEIIDVEVELQLCTPRGAPGGAVSSYQTISLSGARFFSIARYRKGDEKADFAFRVTTDEPIDGLWTTDSHYLRLLVRAKHSLSNFSSVLLAEYHSKSEIKEGDFVFGDSLAVES